jgi:Sulfotransferase family
MSLPNFLIIGAAKSGTTSLAVYLEQHPEIFFCPFKEPNYFALAGQKLPQPGPVPPRVLYKLLYEDSVTDFRQYQSLFDSVRDEKAIGEASVRYLYYPEAASRIHERIPEARLVVILREPVSRLYSHYCMNVQNQLEPLGLADALAEEEARRAAGWGWDWHYLNLGFYARQLRRYYRLFDRERIKVFLYDEFLEKPLAVFTEICRHIGVDPHFVPEMSYRGKVAYRPKNLALDRWLHWPRAVRPGIGRLVPRWLPQSVVSRLEEWNSIPVPRLTTSYREDVMELEELLGRRIPWYA